MLTIVMKKLEKLGLVFVAAIAKIIFMTYKVFATLLAITPLLCFIYFTKSYEIVLYVSLVLTFVILCVTSKSNRGKDNPYRKYTGINGWVDARIDRFIAWIGTLKYFTSPICIVEDPGSYKIKGYEIRQLIDSTNPDRLQPGDILLRGYDGYLDGKLISLSGGAQGVGKYFSHAAVYLGELNTDRDQSIAARRLQVADEAGHWHEATIDQKNTVRNNPEYFQPGRQMVIHSMSRGIFVEDILTFLRCDYLAVLRIQDKIQLSADYFDNKPLASLSGDAEVLYAMLKEGKVVEREAVIKLVHDSALGKIGSCYDFQFNDIKTSHRFSCSEFVYYCYKSIHCYLGLQPKKHAFMGKFFSRVSITPADIYEAAVQKNKLQIIWRNRALIEKG